MSAPFTQCDVFDPYDPPFDPTDPPDDPSAEENRFASDVDRERVLYVGEQTFTTGEGGPTIENFGYVVVVPSENTTLFATEPSLSDGQKQVAAGEFVLAKRERRRKAPSTVRSSSSAPARVPDWSVTARSAPRPRRGSPSRMSRASRRVARVASPARRAVRLVALPRRRSPRRNRRKVPEPPEVDPSDAAGPNYCVLFNPNHPPVDPENPPSEPYQERSTYHDTLDPNGGYTVGEDEAGFRSGPSANRFYGYGFDNEQAVYVEEVTVDTGERQYIVETSTVWTGDTSTVEGRSGVVLTMRNGSQSFPQGAELVCDGEKCEVVVTGDMGATDGISPAYVDDEGTQSGSVADSTSSSGDSASERTVDAASDSAEETSEDVPTDEAVGFVPDLSAPGDGVTELLGL